MKLFTSILNIVFWLLLFAQIIFLFSQIVTWVSLLKTGCNWLGLEFVWQEAQRPATKSFISLVQVCASLSQTCPYLGIAATFFEISSSLTQYNDLPHLRARKSQWQERENTSVTFCPRLVPWASCLIIWQKRQETTYLPIEYTPSD